FVYTFFLKIHLGRITPGRIRNIIEIVIGHRIIKPRKTDTRAFFVEIIWIQLQNSVGNLFLYISNTEPVPGTYCPTISKFCIDMWKLSQISIAVQKNLFIIIRFIIELTRFAGG